MAPTLDQLQADAEAISGKSPAIRRWALETVAYLREQAQPVPPPPPPPPATGVLYFNGDLTTGDLSQWPDRHDMNLGESPPGVSVEKRGDGNYWARIFCDPRYASTSVSGPATVLWAPGSYTAPWLNEGADTYFAAHYRFPEISDPQFPGSFVPMPSAGWGSDFDILMEWHAAEGAGYSTHIGIWRGSSSPYLLLRTSIGAQWYYIGQTDRVQTKANTLAQGGSPNGVLQPLKRNHDYEIVVRTVFSRDPSVGRIQWWVDDVLTFDDHLQTMNVTAGGTVPGVGFENGLYRGVGPDATNAPVDTIYLRGVKAGSTREIVTA